MAWPALDLRLYLVVGPTDCRGRPLPEVVAAAVEGGVTLVQLRDKLSPTREVMASAERLLELLRPRGVPLLLNDRADVALAVGADGVHVGQDDLPAEAARHLLGSGAIVGLTADRPDEVDAAQEAPVDYLGSGPIYPTSTKDGVADAWGVDGFRDLRRRSRHPVVAIGGVTAETAAAAVRAGADGVAVVSAICAADDPERAARRLREAVDAGFAARKRSG